MTEFNTLNFTLSFLLICCFGNIFAAVFDTNSYLGCYVNDRSKREFTAYPGFIDRSTLLPSMCIQACSLLNYEFAAIEQGSFCFCNKNANITAALGTDVSCTQYTCPGDPNTFCGSDTHLLVYVAGGVVNSIKVLETPQMTNSTTFSRFSFSVSYDGPAKYIYITTSDGAVSSYNVTTGVTTGTIPVSQYLTNTGITNLEFSASSSSANSINSKKVAVSSGTMTEDLANVTMVCPVYAPTNDYVLCDVIVNGGGSHLEITVNYGDGGSTDLFTPIDSELYYYGTPVPFNVAPQLLVSTGSANKFYLLTNSEIQFDGTLRAIELYASTGGNVIVYLLSPCSGAYCCKQTLTTQCQVSTSNLFNCANAPFSSVDNYCSNATTPQALRYSVLVGTNINWSFNKSFSFSLQTGYNVFNTSVLGQNIPANSGWMLGVEVPTGSLAVLGVDTSISTYQDYEVTTFTKTASIVSGLISNTLPLYAKVMARALITRPNIISTFRTYAVNKTYTISATLKNTFLQTSKTVSQNVIVQFSITNLTITTPLMCEINLPCPLSSTVSAGSEITYNWNFTDSVRITNDSSFSFTFASFGVRLQYLVATNAVSRRVYSKNVTISEKVTGLQLCAGLCSRSASVVGKEANFTLKMTTGRDYTCQIDFGDSTTMTTDYIINPNNSSIYHNYSTEGIYTVTITCSNLLNSQTVSNNHHVQYEITNIQLVTKGALKNTPYQVVFSLATGTDPAINFIFNGTLDSGMTYNKLTKIGTSSLRQKEPSAVYIVQIFAENYVSQVNFSDTFEVSALIENPSLKILLRNTTRAIYEFPATLDFVVDMTMGSNVKIDLWIGEEELRQTLPMNRTVRGDWPGEQTFYVNYFYPGDYNVTANVSNAMSYFVLTQSITVMSKVDDLIPMLQYDPVLYLSSQSSGRAYFQFKYNGSTYAGSHASVTFDVGESVTPRKVLGSFYLGMDFVSNISKTPMFYDYLASGIYTVTFNVSNPLGFKLFNLSVEVIPGLDGVYIDIQPPQVAPSMTVSLNVYILQGENVNLTWIVDNSTTLGSFKRLSTTYKIPDKYPYPLGPTMKPYYFTLKACDPFFCIFKTATLETQARTNFSVTTNPVNPNLIDNNGSAIARTVTFSIKILDGTNPYYVIDYNDGSIVDFPTSAIVNNIYTHTYTFPDSGFYDVNITVYNLVSVNTQIIRVGLLADFTQFDCSLKWRLYDNDAAIDYDVIYDPIFSVYKVRKEYDLRFYCTWTSIATPLNSLSIKWNNILTTTNYANFKDLRSLKNSTHAGYVISLPVATLQTGRTNDAVTITASNDIYSAVFVAYILKVSSLKNIAFVGDPTVTKVGTSRTFTISYDSLGEPSCARIWYNSGKNISKSIAYGTNQYCNTSFPGVPIMGVYNATGGFLFFDLVINFEGLVNINFLIKNDFESFTAITNVTISGLACKRPTLDIENRSPDFFNPVLIVRSKMFSLVGVTILDCDGSLENIKQWFLYQIDQSTGKNIRKINLDSIPSSYNAELSIPEKFLSYGTYKFVYQVTMDSGSGPFQGTVETYVRIIPTGIGIFAFSGGIKEITRGTAQEIVLDPGKYSYDFDEIYTGLQLKYRFFCRIVVDGLPKEYPSIGYNNYVDLKQIKENNSLVTINSSTTCFDSTDSYYFSNNETTLTIKESSLLFVEGRSYQVYIIGSTPFGDYEQLVKINIVNYNSIPVVNLGCKFQYMCSPYKDYQKINPNTQLMIISECIGGCTNVSSINYQFSVSKEWNIGSDDPQKKWISCIIQSTNTTTLKNMCYLNSTNVIGLNKQELTIMSELFQSEPDIKKWKIDFTVLTTSYFGGTGFGKSSIIVGINELPTNGTCSVSPTTGTTGNTTFTIECNNWKDPDGVITKYEYFLARKDIPSDVLLNYENTGTLKTTLPQGPEYDNYNMQIYVKITDDTGGVVKYTINSLVTVKDNSTLASLLIDQILTTDTKSTVNTQLFSGDLRQSSQVITSLAAMLNSQSYSDKQSVSSNGGSGENTFLTTYGPDRNVSFDATFDSITVISPQYSGVTPSSVNLTNSTFDDDRNKRALVREKLASFITNLTVSHGTSMTLITSVLTSLTQRPDEISRDTANVVTDKCLEVTRALAKSTEKMSVEEIKQAAVGIIGSLGSNLLGISNSLNNRQGYLAADKLAANSIPEYYDTDLENFWTNINNFALDGNYSEDSVAETKNMLYQKYQTVDTINKGEFIKQNVINALSKHSNIGQPSEIKTSACVMTISKTEDTNSSNSIYEGLGKADVPSLCELNPNNDPNGCKKYENVTLATMAMPMAPSGHNGNNETNIGLSSTVAVSFVDSSGNEISITNSSKKIDVWIPRDPSAPRPNPQYVNITTNNRQGSQLFPLGFNITSLNASIHLEFSPVNATVGYVVLVKFGMTPRLNSTFADYNKWMLYCPSDLKMSNNTKKPSYFFFMNSNETDNFKGLVGIGIRELKSDEIFNYCLAPNATRPLTPPIYSSAALIANSTNITVVRSLTSDFYFLSYTAGCYYLDISTGKWSSEGVDVQSDTSIYYTHCKSTHLTTFAGGWVVVPSAIDFNYVFANASFEKNPTIYASLIAISCLYILFCIWGRYMDREDVKKIGVCPLPDNQPGDNYFYEIIVFTGSRKDAGTDSKVRFILSGENDESEIRIMEDDKRKAFRRGGVDSFLMSTKNGLGNLNYMRIWHDNSGKGKWGSWYLKYIVINDIQTKQQFYFICQKWLAVEKDDGLIDRILPVAGEAQKSEFSYLLSKEATKNMSDGHLWFSIFARPAQSAFTRLERITCCFVLLFISMLTNILYYEQDKSTSNGGIEIGPFYLTPEQVGIGIMCNLIIFPPSLLIVELFRRSRRRISRSVQIKEALNSNILQTTDISPELAKNNQKSFMTPNELERIRDQFKSPMPTTRDGFEETKPKTEIKKKKKPITFPWWTKIIAYLLSFTFMGVSAFFVWAKGVEFGDQKTQKWLTSLVISFLSSIFLTQPIKVILVAFFFILIMRKSNDDDDIEDIDDDVRNDRALKKDEEYLHHHPTNIFAKPKSKAFAPLNEGEVEEARENRLKEIKMWDIIREILAYVMFLWVLYIVSYANMNSYSYNYQKNLQNIFVSPTLKRDFKSIMRVEEFWDWAKDVLVPGLRAGPWYQGSQPIGLAGFINDKTSRMIGYATMRQVRVKKDSCTINAQLKNQINFCTADYTFFNEDSEKYNYTWSSYNSSYKPAYSMDRVYNAFQYRSAGDLNGYPIFALYNNYWGGGYVYEMRGQKSYVLGNLTLLQQLGWIDRQTRAVFIEFAVYNPNINMFAVAEITVEFLPSGTILTSSRFDPISLLNHYRGFALFTIVCEVLYVLFIIYFMVNEIREICRYGKGYILQFWSLVEWAIIGFSWAAVGMYAYRIYAGNKVLEFFKQTSGYGYYKLQYVAIWNESLRYSLAFCAGLGTLKFLKLLRFNKRISFLASTMKHSAKELIAFFFMFIIIWCAFVQLMYLFFQDKTIGFSTFIRAMTTCFEIMLGKFQVDPLMKAHSFFGPLLFSLYNIFVVFILLNMFISIINDTFSAVRADVEKQADDYHMINFIVTKLKLWTGIKNSSNQDGILDNPILDANKNSYKDQLSYLPEKIDELLYILSELYVEQRGTNNMYETEIPVLQDNMSEYEQKRPITANSNVMHIDVRSKEDKQRESEMDRRKSAHRNRSALDHPSQQNYRLPTAHGREPPNRLPPINRNNQDSNL